MPKNQSRHAHGQSDRRRSGDCGSCLSAALPSNRHRSPGSTAWQFRARAEHRRSGRTTDRRPEGTIFSSAFHATLLRDRCLSAGFLTRPWPRQMPTPHEHRVRCASSYWPPLTAPISVVSGLPMDVASSINWADSRRAPCAHAAAHNAWGRRGNFRAHAQAAPHGSRLVATRSRSPREVPVQPHLAGRARGTSAYSGNGRRVRAGLGGRGRTGRGIPT